MTIKLYICKMCEKNKKYFSGTRERVRKHIQEEHNIKSTKKYNESGKGYHSPVTDMMEAIDSNII